MTSHRSGPGRPSPAASRTTRPLLSRVAMAVLGVLAITAASLAAGTPADAGTGGRFTFQRPDGSYWGVTFAGAGLGEVPFVADTDGNGQEELAVYYNGRFTLRRDDGSYWGVTIPGGGRGETPIAIDTDGDGRQELGVYYNGRFTFQRPDGSLWGVTFAGAGLQDLPLAVDTNGDGIQEVAVYRAGRFTFLRPDGTYWGVTFAGAGAADLPFVIDTDGNDLQELAVYNKGRMTLRRDDGSYWGLTFAGAGIDEYPLAVDTDGNGRQEPAVYNHVVNMVFAKQIQASRLRVLDYSENRASDSASHSLASQQLTDLAQGSVTVNLSTRCTHYVPPTTQPDPRILQFLTDFGSQSGAGVNSLFGQCHSLNSAHYRGTAVDFACPMDIALADAVGARYDIRHNSESCSANGHMHYSVGGA